MTPWQQRVFIIGEAGVNHNGDPALAMQLVEAAAAAGCDAVKFQTFNSALLATREAPMADYQRNNTQREESQYDMLRRLELTHAAHHDLKHRAAELGLMFFSTAFDAPSMEFLRQLDIPVWKIPSGELTNLPYLENVARMGKPVILSTGMATLAEVDQTVTVLLENGVPLDMLSILHCTTDYPARWEDLNLRAMAGLGSSFGTAYGYSDHSLGCEIPVAAVALGARVIEKHFTLDRTLPGPDHKASLEPAELTSMVTQIRHVELALGDGRKRPTAAESANRAIARKSIVAAKAIRRGETFTAETLTVKRPGTGISPMMWHQIIGRTAARDYEQDDLVQW